MERKGTDPLPIWFAQGNCANLGIDAGVMVPEVGDEQGEQIAKSICIDGCPVFELCDTWARDNRRSDLGIYAAKTLIERTRVTRNINRAKYSRK